MRALRAFLTCLPLLTAIVGCETQPPGELAIAYDFTDGAQGWTADICDYSVGMLDSLEFESGMRDLSAELGDGQGFYLSSMNRSDDAFMFIKRRLTPADGIAPSALYEVAYRIRLATNLPSGCAGVGGAPESSYFKAGASTEEPLPVEDDTDYVGLSVDKGQQSTGGLDASIVGEAGDVTNGDTSCTDTPFAVLTRTHTHDQLVEADEDGNLWLLLGTDSGYEGLTSLYFLEIDVTLTPAAAQ